MILQGTRTSIAKKPYIFVIFQGGGVVWSGTLSPLWIRPCESYLGGNLYGRFSRTLAFRMTSVIACYSLMFLIKTKYPSGIQSQFREGSKMKLVVFFSCICLCWAVITCTPQQRYWIPISTGTYTASWVYGKTRDLLAGRLFMRGFNSGDFYELYRKVTNMLIILLI